MASQSRVLVTRAPHQGSALAEQLRALGLEPVLIPTIEIVEPSSYTAMEAALQSLQRYHWLLFTSANAVSAFLTRWSGQQLPAHVRVAAIGRATATALQAAGITVSLVPPQAVAESMAASLLPFALQPEGTPTRFVLFRAEQGRDELPDALRKAGGELTLVPAYRTVVPASSATLLRQALQGDESAAAITFTSSSSARNLLTLCEAAEISLPEHALRISIGPVTSSTLRDLGIPPHAEAREPTVASLAEAVLLALKSND